MLDDSRRPPALALLPWLLLAAGCRDGAPPDPAGAAGPAVQRLELHAVRATEAGLERTAELPVPDGEDGVAPWSINRADAVVDARRARNGPEIRALWWSQRARVQVPVPRDVPFNRVAVQVAQFERGAVAPLSVAVRVEGGETFESPERRVHGAIEPQTLFFDFPEITRRGARPVRVVIAYGSPKGEAGLSRVDLLRQPAARFLTESSGGRGLVEVGTEARPGWALSSTGPLEARVRSVPPGARLELAVGVPAKLALAGSDPTLVVRARWEGGDDLLLRHRIAVGEAGAPWETLGVDLSELAGEPATLTFELTGPGAGEHLCGLAEPALVVPGPRPPAVLLVTSDTHRADHVAFAERSVDVRTPVLDGLAEEGAFFERAFSSTNITNPSHVALLTGTHPRDTGIVVNHHGLADRAPTLAEAFRDAGWTTLAAISARHLGPGTSGLGQGFDRFDVPRERERDGAAAVDVLSRWLDETADRPVFVWLHVFDAHAPYAAPPDALAAYWPADRDAFDPELPDHGLPARLFQGDLEGLRDLEWPRAQYRGEVTYLDAQLGRLLARPRLADGIVAVTADHGESLGEHGIFWSHAGLYPETVHVPLLLVGPGVPVGARVAAPVDHLRLGRTLLDLAGLGAAPFPGSALDFAPDAPSETLYTISSAGTAAAITRWPWHLILQLRNEAKKERLEPAPKMRVELYDLAADPACLDDRAGAEPATADELARALVAWLEDARPTGWDVERALDSDEVADLAALGYVDDVDEERPAERSWVDAEVRARWGAPR